MVDSTIYAAGIGGLLGGLIWQGLLPYLIKRREAEINGQPIPSFAKEYMTTMLISTITGLIAIFMSIETFEKTIANATSILIAAGIGFSFTYTVLGISNTIVDLQLKKAKLQKESKISSNSVERGGMEES